MISFDFEYYKPTSVAEAVRTFQELDAQGKKTVYYAGGTEIISLARLNQVVVDAVIDIKEIPECNVFQFVGDKLLIGAAKTLNELREVNLFPLLREILRKAADHTSRNKITLGGNICGTIFYRESVLPFLLSDSQLLIAGEEGLKTVSIHEVFDKEIQLKKGEFLVQVITNKEDTELPYATIKKTKISQVEYPLVTVAAVKKDQRVRVAFSGVCAFPFRSLQIEADVNDMSSSVEQRIDHALQHLPTPALDDIRASKEYRAFVLRNTLADSLKMLGWG